MIKICTKCLFREANSTKSKSWCQECYRKYQNEYKLRNRDKILKRRKQYRLIHGAEQVARDKLHRQEIKNLVMNHYGAKCVCCKEYHFDFLNIDHIDDNGNTHRKENNIKPGYRSYKWLIKNNFPSGFQILCANCNNSKHFNGKCLHIAPFNENRNKYSLNIKRIVLQHYGDKCLCCNETGLDFLTIDHMNGSGRQHRHLNKISGGNSLYYWLRRNDYPVEYQVLCFNCNISKFLHNGQCVHNSI